MQFPGSLARACAALVLLCACAAEATTPSLLWADARQLAVNCLVQGDSEAQALQDTLCDRVLALAGRGAPFPVARAEAGDPILISPGTVTLRVHASAARSPRGRVVAFTIRPSRAAEGGDVPFGTAPKILEIPAGDPAPALDAALGEALADVLPWHRPSGLVARSL